LARLAEALAGIPCQSAVIDAELVFPAANGVPDFAGLRTAFAGSRQYELAVFAFDLMHRDGADLTGLPLADRRRRLERLLAQSQVSCLHLVRCFAALFIGVDRHGLEGSFRSDRRQHTDRDPRAIGSRSKLQDGAANQERWRLFE
jgi:ATP-dependent DNA ligase